MKKFKFITVLVMLVVVMLALTAVSYADESISALSVSSSIQPVVDMTVTSDSGYFDDGTGVIRFITTLNSANVDVIAYGTYIIPLALFDKDNSSQQTVLYLNNNTEVAPGESYQADLINIPASQFNCDVYAVSFAITDYEYGETGEPELFSESTTAKVNQSKYLGESYTAMKEAE